MKIVLESLQKKIKDACETEFRQHNNPFIIAVECGFSTGISTLSCTINELNLHINTYISSVCMCVYKR